MFFHYIHCRRIYLPPPSNNTYKGLIMNVFPTCQVRVVSCCPPPPSPPPPHPPVSPRPCLHQLPPPLPPCQALRQLPSSVRTAGPQPGTFPAQCQLLDLNLGPSQLSAHRWTSTWDLPSSVPTAGPQPGTFPAQCPPLDLNLGPFPAQCAPLDLNLKPSQLSAHC